MAEFSGAFLLLSICFFHGEDGYGSLLRYDPETIDRIPRGYWVCDQDGTEVDEIYVCLRWLVIFPFPWYI